MTTQTPGPPMTLGNMRAFHPSGGLVKDPNDAGGELLTDALGGSANRLARLDGWPVRLLQSN
jgi:hypothetical protein